MPALMRSLADVHKSLMLYPGVEGHGTSVHLDRQGQQRDGHAVFQQSAACWGGSGLAWLGLHKCVQCIIFCVHAAVGLQWTPCAFASTSLPC
jgi:hypothetical protein